MGEVYLAQHPRLPRRDALKVLPTTVSADREFRERFHREADIAATLWHPHIVGVHDRGEVDGQLWISMDYAEGTDAGRLLQDRYPNGMPPQEVCEIITAVAGALDYAHQRDLLHRDVKPSNILLARPESGEQRILLADFGIARWANDISGLTATNMTVGTVSYAAPEQLMGSQIDGRADQYALAATAFQLLTGSPPFQHSNPTVVISQHLSAPVPRLADRRPELASLDPALSKALAKDPAARFDRCLEFANALTVREAIDLGTDATRPAAVASREATTQPPRSRSVLRAGIVVPAILAVLLVAPITLAAIEFVGKRDEERLLPTRFPAAASPSAPAPPPPTTAPPVPPPTATAAPAPSPASPAQPVAVTGANCWPARSTGVAENGSTAYCSHVQYSNAYVWSLSPATSITRTRLRWNDPFGCAWSRPARPG